MFLRESEGPPTVHRDGHLGVALALYAPLGHLLATAGAPWLAVGGALLAASLTRLPDHDLRVPGLSHRGATHSVAFAAAVGVAGATVAGALAAWASPAVETLPGAVALDGSTAFERAVASPAAARSLGFAVGAVAVLAHLAADWLTPMGVPLLWPLSGRRFSVGVVTADDVLANYALLVAGVAVTLGWTWPLVAAW